MNYKDQMKNINKDDLLSLVSTIISIHEEMKRDNLIKWIGEYPEYWIAICNMDTAEITAEYAEKVMKTLKDSNIIELQTVWMFKCGDKIDIFGKAIASNEE